MTRWVKQLRDERAGKTPKASPITPEKIEIRELKKNPQHIEMENEILKSYRAPDDHHLRGCATDAAITGKPEFPFRLYPRLFHDCFRKRLTSINPRK